MGLYLSSYEKEFIYDRAPHTCLYSEFMRSQVQFLRYYQRYHRQTWDYRWRLS
jgi:hypothetical protein